jgi:hypothetical protein
MTFLTSDYMALTKECGDDGKILLGRARKRTCQHGRGKVLSQTKPKKCGKDIAEMKMLAVGKSFI